jgi:hypothetical protein
MSEASDSVVQSSESKSNLVTNGIDSKGTSLIKLAVELAKTSVIVNGVLVVVGDMFGGGLGGTLDRLKQQNPVAKFDGAVRFDDSINAETGKENHDYYVMEKYGERHFHGSCTGMIGKCFPEFDAKAVYAGMVKKGRIDNPTDEYYQMTEEVVLAQWAKTGLDARTAGKAMHKAIEQFLNNAYDPDDPIWESEENRDALNQFLRYWVNEIVGKLVPVRTELIMFSRFCEFAGQADFAYKRVEWLVDHAKRHWLGVGDWKRSKEDFDQVDEEEKRRRAKERLHWKKKTGFGPCVSLEDTALNHYRLQMSLYATCLMRETDFEVRELHLGIFHPTHPEYLWFRAEPLYAIADKMLIDRRQHALANYSAGLIKDLEDVKKCLARYDTRSYPIAEMEQIDRALDYAKSLGGLVHEATLFGASPEEILGTNKRSRLETTN